MKIAQFKPKYLQKINSHLESEVRRLKREKSFWLKLLRVFKLK